jgi:quaternary ammonium compound-resistance protein SugE
VQGAFVFELNNYSNHNIDPIINTKTLIMNWIILIIAGIFETVFAFCLGKARENEGLQMYAWYTGFLVSLIVSMALLIKASRSIPIGTAYAVWTGIGAVGTVVIGIVVFKEPFTFRRIFFLLTLIGSIIGLKAMAS